jgi:hypothetical protein
MEDEKHFILNCPQYETLRGKYKSFWRIFGLEHLPVSIVKECALTLIFVNNDLSDLVKLNLR